ncbi:Uncharacterised protein [Mycobacterium tuberculosis]|nr:Uncharacterised protein [Mycobacterium tuberculosis]
MGFRVENGRVAVPFDERLGHRPLGQPADLGQHVAGGVDVDVAEFAMAQSFVDAQHFEQVKNLVTDVAPVVAHCRSSSLRVPPQGWVGLGTRNQVTHQ